MVHTEKELAKAIMSKESYIYLSDDLVSGVRKIIDPSEVVWKSVISALVASAFFWGSPCACALGFAIGLPAILAVCGGVGGIVFVTLGVDGTLTAFRLLIAAQKIDVVSDLHDKYILEENKLKRK